MRYLVAFLLFSISFLELPAQTVCDGDLCVVQFNASFNSSNEVTWLGELTDCNINTVDIVANPSLPKEYKIVVVPTILILEDGEEVARFQANIMMQMEATRKEVQGSMDEIIMSKF
mgnify:FL=1